MTDAVPPGAQCSQDGCEREAVDPNHPAGFCPEHHPTVEADDQDDHADDPTRTGTPGDTAESGENTTTEPDSPRSNPTLFINRKRVRRPTD
jgi:hypothetical protein